MDKTISPAPLDIDWSGYTWAVRLEQGDRIECMRWLAQAIYDASDYFVAVDNDGVHLLSDVGLGAPYLYVAKITSPAEWNQWKRDHVDCVYGDDLPE